jgi:hypothetical protein
MHAGSSEMQKRIPHHESLDTFDETMDETRSHVSTGYL